MDNNGFRDLLRDELKDIRQDVRDTRSDIDEVKESLAKVREDVGGLKVKSGLIGAIAGTIVFLGSEAWNFLRGIGR